MISNLQWYVTRKRHETYSVHLPVWTEATGCPTRGPLVIRILILNYHNYKNTFFANFHNISHYTYHCVRKLPTVRILSTNTGSKTYRTVRLPAVLHGCETLSLTIRKEDRLRVLESRVLRKICGPKGWELTAQYRWLHSEGRHDYPPYQMLVTWTFQGGCDWWGM